MPQQPVDSGQYIAGGMGWVESIAVFDKDERFIYAGSNSGGIYCTEDGGKHWRNVSPPGRLTGVLDIEISSEKPSELWIATGTPVNRDPFGLGILHSTNGGKTWEKTGLSFKREGRSPAIWQIERSDSDPDIFYACSETRIYKSVDACATFSEIHIDAEDALFRHLEIHPSNSDLVVCSGKRTLISRDGGDTWVDCTEIVAQNRSFESIQRIAVSLHPKYEYGLAAVYHLKGRNYITESADWGATWHNVHIDRDYIRLDRNHAEIKMLTPDYALVGSVRLFGTNVESGRTRLLTQPIKGAVNYAHDDIREIEVTSSGHIYIATDGGVEVSRDSGATWVDISGFGLNITQIYDFDVSSKGGIVAIGCQDLSTTIYRDGVWSSVAKAYGDGGAVEILDDTLMYMVNGTPYQTILNDTTLRGSRLRIPYNSRRFMYPYVHSEEHPEGKWFIGDTYLWIQDAKGNWTQATTRNETANAPIVTIDVHSSGQILFANDEPTWGTGPMLDNRLFKSVGTGDSIRWIDLTANLSILAWRSIADIQTDPQDPDRIWLSVYGYDSDTDPKAYKVFFSEDGGETWHNYSQGLPNYSTYCLYYIPGSSDGMLLGTDGGLYYREPTMDKWQLLAGKNPGAMVRAITIDQNERMVYVATYGNGVWKARLPKKFFK